jgi:hypothetical protein
LLAVIRLARQLTIHPAVVVVRVLLVHLQRTQVLLAALAALAYHHP